MKTGLTYIAFVFLILSCSAKTIVLPQNQSKQLLPDTIKLEHLIKITYQDRKFVFHGFFYKNKDEFFVNALGDFDMAIFALEYKKAEILFEIYLSQLKEKSKEFDFRNVGKDIWKIYFPENSKQLDEFNSRNPIEEKNVVLVYNEKGYLIKKILQDQNLKKLIEITYQDYDEINGIIVPKVILLKHDFYQLQVVTVGLETKFTQPEIKKP